MSDITQEDYDLLKARAETAEKAVEEANGKLGRFEETFQARFKVISDERDTALSELKTVKTSFAVDRALMTDGIDDEGIVEFLKFKHSKLEADEEGNVKDFGDWYNGYKETKPVILNQWLNKTAEVAETKVPESIPNQEEVNPEAEVAAVAETEVKTIKEPVVDTSKVFKQGEQSENTQTLSPQEISSLSFEAFELYMNAK